MMIMIEKGIILAGLSCKRRKGTKLAAYAHTSTFLGESQLIAFPLCSHHLLVRYDTWKVQSTRGTSSYLRVAVLYDPRVNRTSVYYSHRNINPLLGEKEWMFTVTVSLGGSGRTHVIAVSQSSELKCHHKFELQFHETSSECQIGTCMERRETGYNWLPDWRKVVRIVLFMCFQVLLKQSCLLKERKK
ncbi:hypothetical protein CEXT_190391 [Caerostris extrusa]|uniref:Uncharacterized protein n=1 Tax=Caerostris extrusa TaxID=172846 RepID=A0AAV4M879_CAEEX|nr:hypothetical protein CEXT_190391 [Caerostris extrusa]